MNLVEVIKAGDRDAIQVLLQTDPGLARGRDGDGVSFVSLAMYHRQPEIAQRLAASRTDLDVHEACAVGLTQRVRELVELDPSCVNKLSPDGFPPVALAAFFGHADIVELLTEAGADINAQAQNPMKVAAIHAAVAARDIRSTEILLRNGANPNLRQQKDYTPLKAAQMNNDQAMIDLLVAYGAQ